MLNLDTTVTLGNLVQLLGYIVVAIGLYYGIKLDLQSSRLKAESASKKAEEAHNLAGEAHDKIYNHITNHHTHARRSDNCDN